jgi:archaellum component FlaC
MTDSGPPAGEPDNLVLAHLRAIRGTLDDHTRRFEEIILRLGRVEREIANLHTDFATLSLRLDRLDERVSRIERRLDLVEMTPPQK